MSSKGTNDKRKLELAQLQGIMRQDAGRALLCRQLEHSGFFDSTWNLDARQHAFNEGRRSEGLWLFRELQEADPELAKLIVSEHFTYGHNQ